MATGFTALGLSPQLLAAITDAGYEAPTAIQARTIPPLLAGRDLIGQAQTGTGKTAAFALPILHRLDVGRAACRRWCSRRPASWRSRWPRASTRTTASTSATSVPCRCTAGRRCRSRSAVAERYLRQPESIEIERTALTIPAIEQRYLNVTERQKLDALTRVLEVEASEATLVFVRTKTNATAVAERLQARGYAAEAMHGDMTQAPREQTIGRLRAGQLEIVVATDVAARGLDVRHITHVLNYDVPHDPESYVHRIGRTGRAGRTGIAILFITPRQTRLRARRRAGGGRDEFGRGRRRRREAGPRRPIPGRRRRGSAFTGSVCDRR